MNPEGCLMPDRRTSDLANPNQFAARDKSASLIFRRFCGLLSGSSPFFFSRNFFRQTDRCVQTVSMPRGKFRITDAITRNRGRAALATSGSIRSRFQIHFSERNFYRSWMRIVTLNVPSNMACSSLCSFSRRSFSLKSPRGRRFILFST